MKVRDPPAPRATCAHGAGMVELERERDAERATVGEAARRSRENGRVRRRTVGDRESLPFANEPANVEAEPLRDAIVQRRARGDAPAPELRVQIATPVDHGIRSKPGVDSLTEADHQIEREIVQQARVGGHRVLLPHLVRMSARVVAEVEPTTSLRPDVRHVARPRGDVGVLKVDGPDHVEVRRRSTVEQGSDPVADLLALGTTRHEDATAKLQTGAPRDAILARRAIVAVLRVTEDERGATARDGRRGTVLADLLRAAGDLLGILAVVDDVGFPVAIRDSHRAVGVVRHGDGLAVRAVRTVRANAGVCVAELMHDLAAVDAQTLLDGIVDEGLRVDTVVARLRRRGPRRRGRRSRRRRWILVGHHDPAVRDLYVDVGTFVLDRLHEIADDIPLNAGFLLPCAALIELPAQDQELVGASLLVHVDGAFGLGRTRPADEYEHHRERGNQGRDRLEERVHVNPYHGRSRVVLQRSFGLRERPRRGMRHGQTTL